MFFLNPAILVQQIASTEALRTSLLFVQVDLFSASTLDSVHTFPGSSKKIAAFPRSNQ
jgi:hypothetical protein